MFGDVDEEMFGSREDEVKKIVASDDKLYDIVTNLRNIDGVSAITDITLTDEDVDSVRYDIEYTLDESFDENDAQINIAEALEDSIYEASKVDVCVTAIDSHTFYARVE